MSPKIRVAIVDDHDLVRRGLRALLEAEDDLVVTVEAPTYGLALQRIVADPPDVAILDVRLPDGDGVELCREIRSRVPEVRCLMLTSYADDEALFSAIMADAAGYLLKEVRDRDLVTAIRRVAGGESLLDPAVTGRVLARLRMAQVEDPRVAALTERELEVLDLIAEGHTNRQIGEQVHLAEKTVKNHVSSILAKLQMSRRTEAAVFWSQHNHDEG